MHYDLRRLRNLFLARHSCLILEAFDERRRVLEKRLRKARRKPSEKAIHDLRVALRRMLSMLTLVETVLPSSHTRKTRRKLKRRLDKLGVLRDVQMQIALSDELLAAFPQLTSFRAFLMRRERRLIRRIALNLDRMSVRRLRNGSDRLMADLISALDPKADAVLGGRIAASIEDAYRRVLALRSRIDPKETASIHRMRIAFKKFRYMAEITAPCFPRLTPERLQAMHAYQDRMGAIQDLNALLRTMMEFRRSSGRNSILVVENEIRRRRQRLTEEFFATVDELRFFWSTPQVESREVV